MKINEVHKIYKYIKRWEQKDTPVFQIALSVWKDFCKINHLRTKSVKTTDAEFFICSREFDRFMRFAEYVITINPIDCFEFVKYLLSNKIKPDDWHYVSVYEKFVKEFILKENLTSAIKRSILYIKDWEKDNKKDFYKDSSPNFVSLAIANGRISPSLIYLSDKMKEKVSSIEDFIKIEIKDLINEEYWKMRLKRQYKEVNIIKQIIEEAKL